MVSDKLWAADNKYTIHHSSLTAKLRLFSFQTSKEKERLRFGSHNDPGVTAPKNFENVSFSSFDVSGAGTPLPLC